MSIIKSIKQVLGLGPAAENHFWDGSVANQLSLKRGTPDAPGAELIKALNGVLSFPNQGQDLASNGYVKLPGGLIVQWGLVTTTVTGFVVTFPVAFPSNCASLICTAQTASPLICTNEAVTPSGFTTRTWNLAGAQTDSLVRWTAIGY